MEDITMKKRYQKPHTHVVVLQHQSYLLASTVPDLTGNSDMTLGGGSDENPGSRQGQGFLFDED